MSTIFKCAKRNDVASLKKLLASGYTLDQKTFDDETILHIASLRGSEDVVTFALTQKVDVNAKTRNFRETALHMAIQEGHANIAKLLMENNSDCNAENCEGETPLFIAVRWSRESLIPLLVSNGANVNHLNANRESPLAVALMFKNPKIVNALLTAKADTELACIDKKELQACKGLSAVEMNTSGAMPSPRCLTPQARSPRNGAFSRFARNIDNVEVQDAFQIIFDGEPSALSSLISKGFNVNTKIHDNETLIHTAAQLNKAEFVKILIAAKCDLNAKTAQFQETPLHLAISEDAVDAARLLIEAGADLESENVEGETPIFAAVKSGNAEMIGLLIARNANIRHENRSGITPHQLALMLGEEEISRKFVVAKDEVVIRDTRPKSTSAIPIVPSQPAKQPTIKQPTTKPPISSRKVAPPAVYDNLFAAIRNHDRTTVKLLIEQGIELNVVNEKSGIPLHVAIESGDLEIVKALIGNGADVDFGDTEFPLHVAIRTQKKDIARYLLSQNCNTNLCNKENESPLYTAIRVRDVTLVQALIERRCDMNTVNANNMSPLYIAIGLKQIPIVKCMLNNGADPNGNGLGCLKLAQDLHDNQMINVLMSSGARAQIRRANKSRMHQSALARTIPVARSRVKGENGVCAICRGRTGLLKLIPCNHAIVCKKCVSSFVEKNSQCSICNMGFYATAPV